MRIFCVVVFGVLLQLCYVTAQTSHKIVDIKESCCTHGQIYALRQSAVSCSEARISDNVKENQSEACIATMKSCCEIQLQQKTECAGGMKLAELKLCNLPTSNIAKACCYECSLGQLQGETQGTTGCGNITEDFSNSTSALIKNAYYNCCVTAAEDSETKATCQTKSCEHICKEEQGRVRCECREGFRLHTDNKSCKDIDECLEGTHQCDQTQNCINTLGAHECPCKDGYELESALGSCVVTPQYESKYACEGKTLEIGCSEGFVIKLIRANYGRFLITTCNKLGVTNWDVNCLSTRSLRIVHNRCHMHQSCSILASTSIFGDPCPNTGKYLEAHYQCVPAPTTTTSRPSPPPWFATAHPI